MFINFDKYNSQITDVNLNSNNNELILKTDKYKYYFEAVGDCCSCSIFRKYNNNFTDLIGKIIKSIDEINLPDNYHCKEDTHFYGGNAYINPHLYEMTFKNSNDTFQFLLINYSNGYYDGWIQSTILL